MDPFSLATGIGGLLSLAGQIASSLAEFQHSFRNARESYARLISEVTAISGTLAALQVHVSKTVDARATTLLQQPITHCRATLEQLRKEVLSDEPKSLRRRLAWAKREEQIMIDFIETLERYKMTFNLALQIDVSGQVDNLQASVSKLVISRESDLLQATENRNEKQLREIVDWLKPLDMEASLESVLQFRQPGTCEWLLESDIINEWNNSTSGSFIWLHGIPGNGKTVLSSVLIERLLQECTKDEVILYAFCDFRNQRSVDPVLILTTFLAGLLQAYSCGITPDFEDLVDSEKKGKSPPKTVARLVPLIRRAARRFRRTTIILDGLDECEHRESLVELLPTLASEDGFHVFVASRTEQDIREAFDFANTISLQTESSHVGRDIEQHIDRELQRRPQLARLSQDIQATIRDTLSARAAGMFRLVQCQLDLLCRQRTYKSLTNTLQNLPNTLMEMYDRILERIEGYGEETEMIARRALRWIAGAQWPIRVSELAEAIMIEPCCAELNMDYMVTSNGVILDVLSSLVVHEADSDVINLSHFSVLEYFMSSHLIASPLSSYRLPSQSILTNEIFALIIDYTLMDDFNRPLFEIEEDFDLFFANHPLYCNAANREYWKDALSVLDGPSVDAVARFIHAAERHGALHWHLVQQVWTTGFHGRFQKNLNSSMYSYHGRHPLPWLIEQRIPPSLIEAVLPTLPTELIQCCLFAAISAGNIPAIEILIDAGADVNRADDHVCFLFPSSLNPLAFALNRGNLPMVRALLEFGAAANAVMIDGSTALHWAAYSCIIEAVELLLENPSHGIDLNARDINGRTAYMIATQLGSRAFMRLLADYGATEELNLAGGPSLEIKLSPEGVLQVALSLCRMLRGQLKLVPRILDLAECWAVSSTKRSDPEGVVYESDRFGTGEPYLTLKITGRHNNPLQRVVFTTVSHDQGWSDHTTCIGTYKDSHSWFEVGNRSLPTVSRVPIQHNVHGSDLKRTHRIVWVTGVHPKVSDCMRAFKDGDVLEVYARAGYPGWENHVFSIEVVAYTACW